MAPTDTTAAIEALYVFAYRKMEQDNYRDAATALRLMLHLAPNDERSWLALGLCHEQVDQLEVASELYAAGAVAAQPSGRCALACARLLLRRRQVDKAAEQYEAALAGFEALGEDELHAVARREMELCHAY